MATALSPASTTTQVLEAAQPSDDRTPTTPKPAASQFHPVELAKDESHIETPTRVDFSDVPGQQTLHTEPPIATPLKDVQVERQESRKRDSLHLSPVMHQDGMDTEMGDAEHEHADEEDDGSDNDSVASDSRPSKKKKGQRFFCTDYPPCQLSFTRSEHLARHIRKHTGERPFQCHCSRRFSRLDNLRQHAQTVHVNEEIPGDSLAATSTRFQRQIRTDRVRPPTSRSRASTINSNGGHSRGHSRNVSTSSIGSTTSSIGTPDDSRRRPQPLAMANDATARARLTLDTYNTAAGTPMQQHYTYYNQSPTGYSTPTSMTFSNGPDSPRFGSAMASPASTLSRSSFYNGARRRLSVPSAQYSFQQQGGGSYPPPMPYNPMVSGAAPIYSQNSSTFGSPTSSMFSPGRRDSDADMEYRRRTWHPGTNSGYTQRPATSGLSYHQTPDDQRPAFSGQPAASQVTRLPGIESFDHAPPPNARQPTSPMMIDSTMRPPSSGRPSDAGLHQGLTRLDITAANAPPEMQWHSQQPHMVAPPGYMAVQPATVAPQQIMHRPVSMQEPLTPRKNKRQAWYGGPVHPPASLSQRPSPEDSGSSDGVPTPGISQGTEYHPVIINPHSHADAYPPGAVMAEDQKVHYAQHPELEPTRADSGFQHYPQEPPSSQTYALQAGHDPRFATQYAQQPNHDMGRLEALVAVATSEGRAAERS